MRYIDLFCGIGGFHQVLSKLGHECVLACDIDKECRKVYENNYGIKPVDDIKTLKVENIPEIDILCGGFPCQAFSNAGKKKSFDDNRGLLFDEIVRIAKAKKPKFMFLENVKHILKVSNGEVIKYIYEKLDDIGYKVQNFKMSPHEYGIPQNRERIYFICVKNEIYNEPILELKYPKERLNNKSLERILEKDEKIIEKYRISEEINQVLNSWEYMIKKFEVGEKINPTILPEEFYTKYTKKEFDEIPKWKQEYIQKNKPLYTKYSPVWDEWWNNNKEHLKIRKIYAQLDWQVGPIKEKDSIFNYFIQVRQSGIRVKKPNFFPTLVAITQTPIYAKEKRYITPRECARLQSFPDDFILHENEKQAYKQLGNSVNVTNVKNIIETTLEKYEFV